MNLNRVRHRRLRVAVSTVATGRNQCSAMVSVSGISARLQRRSRWCRPRKLECHSIAKDDLNEMEEEEQHEIVAKSKAIAQSPVPLGSYEADLEDVLHCETLWDVLEPRLSPFSEDNNMYMGFVSNHDRVAISSLFHGSKESIGANCGGAAIYNAQEDVCIPISPWAYRSGARKMIYFNPTNVRAAVVTCGGLCPGLNDVVRGIVHTLYQYGVRDGNILGIKYGFRGFYSYEWQPVTLTMNDVDGIQRKGGTLLGTSRGGADMDKIVDAITERAINMVFVIGGNGGNAGAAALHKKCKEKNYPCSVVGVPKSIDNDILVIDKTFGFDTACQEAVKAINAAYVEASSALRGVGLVKLMGRQSGFIAVQASLASGEVDVCLIPESEFELHGESGLLAHIARVVESKGHCIVVVAEGACQDVLAKGSKEKDASGNPVLEDVGRFLRDQIKDYFCEERGPRKKVDFKYIDPTYMIRAVETNTADKLYCNILAQGAVHAAFGGFTGVTVGVVNTHAAYFPIDLLCCTARKVDTKGKLWQRLLTATNQPASWN